MAVSNFGTTADFADDIPGLMKSAIGQQNVTASALQMALVAGAVANGGVEMTPHVMSQIRDSQGNLVKVYQPKAWLQPISPETANTLTTFMQGVAKSGTAAGVFPPAWNVAAKTGTAQTGSFGPNPQFTDDWLIAFAPVEHPKVAIAVVMPKQPGSATGAKYSGPSSSRSSATCWPTRRRRDDPTDPSATTGRSDRPTRRGTMRTPDPRECRPRL